MRIIRTLLAALLLLSLTVCLPCALGAGEETARDIAAACRLRFSQNGNDKGYVLDGYFMTYWRNESGRSAWVEITAPEGEKIHGLYILWAETLVHSVIERAEGDGWTVIYESADPLFYEQYIPLEGEEHIRIRNPEKDTQMAITELHVLTEGALPDWVHVWQPFEGKADIMTITAHPDDEVLYLGGVIPYYRSEQGKSLIHVNVSRQPASRKCELLECLWVCGVHEYPVVSGDVFKDEYSRSLNATLDLWGKDRLKTFVVRQLRRYKPDVVVTHDLKGEYGHGAHRATAWALTECVSLAADERYDPASAAEYGVWQVKKLYIHLYGENTLVMDWRQPLSAFDGQTAFDVACAAFKKHRTQQSGKYEVEDWGPYNNSLFGLWFSAVGDDTPGANDMFEHIETWEVEHE